MRLDDYRNSAHYRQRLSTELRTLFPESPADDDELIAGLTRENVEQAFEARRHELIQRFGSNIIELDLRQSRLTACCEHVLEFHDAILAEARRTGATPAATVAEPDERLFQSIFLGEKHRAQILAVGGGKGGVGKSMVAANLAVTLASLGRQVIAVDLDLGGADLHLSLGLRSLGRSLNDFVDRKYESLDDIRLATAYKNLSLIATDSSRLGAANIKYADKEKVLRAVGQLDCDIVLIDLGAEVSFNVLDVFLAADRRYVVTSPEPTSVLEAYGLIKLSLYRKLRHFAGELLPPASDLGRMFDSLIFEKNIDEKDRPKNMWQLIDRVGEADRALQAKLLKVLYSYEIDLVINMSESERDVNIARAVAKLCQENLALNLRHGYRVPWDRAARDAARRLIPLVVDSPNSAAAHTLAKMAADASATPMAPDAVSKRLTTIAAGAKQRTQKMNEMSALGSPHEAVHSLIPPISPELRTKITRVRDFLNKDVHFPSKNGKGK